MKKQKTIFENSVRENPLQYIDMEKERLYLKENVPKEFVTKNGAVIIVVKKNYIISGVSLYKIQAYQINDCGKIIEPLKSIGVKNYIKNN